jgi:hypothetical protein
MADPRVEPLQRELCAVLKGQSYFSTWCQVNGHQGETDMRGHLDRCSRARALRERIRGIDPAAATYENWGCL